MSIKDGKIFGIGINDANYKLSNWEIIEGVYCPSGRKKYKCTWRCPYYSKWRSMLQRCYDSNYHKTRPTYKDCTVCEEWKTFSNFKKWMEQQDWVGKSLDKDFLMENNKVYSPESCIFIPLDLNRFILDNNSFRGGYMLGVCSNKGRGKNFYSYCNNPFTKKQEFLGAFDTEISAHLAWKNKKRQHASLLAELHPEVKDVLTKMYTEEKSYEEY